MKILLTWYRYLWALKRKALHICFYVLGTGSGCCGNSKLFDATWETSLSNNFMCTKSSLIMLVKEKHLAGHGGPEMQMVLWRKIKDLGGRRNM